MFINYFIIKSLICNVTVNHFCFYIYYWFINIRNLLKTNILRNAEKIVDILGQQNKFI